MSNFIFFINDAMQVILFLTGFGISFIGFIVGFSLAILSYFNFIVMLYLLFILIFKRNKEQMPFENSLEVIYCFIAPVVYLCLIFNTNIPYLSKSEIILENSLTLNILAWITLGIYWLIRIIPNINDALFKKYIFFSKSSVYFCFLILTLFIWKDFSFLLSKINASEATDGSIYSRISNPLFYILPYFFGMRRLNLIQNIKEYLFNQEELSLFLKRIRLISFLLIGQISFNFFQKTDTGISLRLKSLDAEITNYSRDYEVDKTLVKAIIYTNYKHYLNPMKSLAEYIALGSWVIDDKSHLGWSKKFSVSVGAAQIQPTTAQKAILLGMLNYKNQPGFFSKEYRMVAGELSPEWKIEDATLKIKTIHLDVISPFQVALELADPSMNIQYCAYILYLYQSQWKSANYDISGKPDILATLYQIGFDKSIPKQNPISNEYGRKVKEAYDYIQMHELKETSNLMLHR